ncbi:MAG TPA: vitamin K epoxide reductase family protein [Jatrophihabitantaceae bacterium]|jgi:uncharacterized membrane protein
MPSTRHSGLASLVVALAGLAVSAFLTVEHFSSSTTLACPESATINCQKVTTSHWSHLGPIPVAVLGLVFFAAMSALCVPPVWRRRALDPARVGGAALGVVTALVLVWIELFRIDAICLWCTAVHVCSLVLLGTVLWTTSAVRARS